MRSKMRRNLGLRVQVETPQWADKLVIRKVASRPSAAASIYFDDICCWVMGELFFLTHRSFNAFFFFSLNRSFEVFFNHSINGPRRNYVEMIRIMKGTLFIICSSFDVSEAPVRCSDNIQSAIKSLSWNQIVHSSYMYTVTQ